jgi:putative toxin-antitoxin system antitoxin component (TIGR02293 family)
MSTGAIKTSETGKVIALLGGARAFRTIPAFSASPDNPLIIHSVIQAGFPGQVLTLLVSNVPLISNPVLFEKALGISQRTFQRKRKDGVKRLGIEQSSRTWKFAEIVAKATDVLGSQDAAERWLETPAMSLERQRPIDLLATAVGTELVEQVLEQMEFGVYI